jgi:hypothetical protein
MEKAPELFEQPPTIEKIDIVANKLPLWGTTYLGHARIPDNYWNQKSYQFWFTNGQSHSKDYRSQYDISSQI